MALQRAFRQRKETYIRKLEAENKSVETFREQIKALLHENYALREYTVTMQGRLIDASLDVPEPPPGIDLSQSRHDISMVTPAIPDTGSAVSIPQQQTQPQHQHPSSANDGMSSLNDIAVAGLGMRKHPDENAFMAGSYQHNKRVRDENQPDGSEGISKQEAHHGLPIA